MWRLLSDWYSYSKFLRAERRERKHRISSTLQADCCRKIDAARSRLIAGNTVEALRLWTEARSEFPELATGLRAGLLLLLDLRRFEEAEQAMWDGHQRKPNNPFFLEGLALISTRRGNHEEAIQRYSVLRRKFPRELAGYFVPASLLSKEGRLEEADYLLSLAPTAVAGKIARANVAMERHDWALALRRWQEIKDIYQSPEAPLQIVRCLREMGCYAEAENMVAATFKYPVPNALPFLVEMARISEAKKDWSEASRRWSNIRMAAPREIDAYCEGSHALLNCGQIGEAERVLQIAVEKFPDLPRPWIEYARIAERRHDACAAAERWEVVRSRFPGEARHRPGAD